MELGSGNVLKKLVISWGFTRSLVVGFWFLVIGVDVYTRVSALCTHKLYTFFTQAVDILNIESLPNGVYLFTDHVIELNGFFNLFNRVNSSCVVFSAEFTSNLRKA